MNILEFSFSLISNATSKEKRFVRLTPFRKPNILFFDKKEKTFVNLHSRSRSDSITANQVLIQEDYSISKLKRKKDIETEYHRILQSGKLPLIIDCGCNIGLSSYYFASSFPESSVIGIDPDVQNIKMAVQLCSRFPSITIRQAAIGPEAGFVDIKDPLADSNKFEVVKKNTGSIPMLSIPSIVKDYPDHELFIVKVDIEGFEKELFNKNYDWIQDPYLLFVEPHDWMFPKTQTIQNFLHVISSSNRDFVLSNDNIVSIKNDFNPVSREI